MNALFETRKQTQPKAISGLVDHVVASTGKATDINGWRVVDAWPEIVGEAIAARAKAVGFADGVLYVEIADSAWRQELSMKLGSLLQAIHRYSYGRAVTMVRLSGRKRTNVDGNQNG